MKNTKQRKKKTISFSVKVTVVVLVIGLSVIWGLYYITRSQTETHFIDDLQETMQLQALNGAQNFSSNHIDMLIPIKEQSIALGRLVFQNEENLSENSEYTGKVNDVILEYMRSESVYMVHRTLVEYRRGIHAVQSAVADDADRLIPKLIHIVEIAQNERVPHLVKSLADSFQPLVDADRRLWVGKYLRGSDVVAYDLVASGVTIAGAYPQSDSQYYAATPLYLNGNIVAALIFDYDITNNLSKVNIFLKEHLYNSIIGSVAFVVLATLFLIILFIPFRSLKLQARALQNFDLNSRAYVRTNDDVALIAASTNLIVEKLQKVVTQIKETKKTHERVFPVQYLDFLHKNSISELELGEYTERYMCVLSLVMYCPDVMHKSYRSSQEIFDLINENSDFIAEIVNNHSGFIKSSGELKVLILFPSEADSALNAAIEIQEKATAFNAHRAKQNKPAITYYSALHQGTVAVGITGDRFHLRPYISADTVGLTLKISDIAYKIGAPIIISDGFNKNITKPSNYLSRYLGGVPLGVTQAIQVYDVIDGYPEDIRKIILATKVDFDEAVKGYERNYISRARDILSILAKSNPRDKVVQFFINHVLNQNDQKD